MHRAHLLLAIAGAVACEGPVRVIEAPPGHPVPGLAAAEAERFAAGQSLFNRPFTQEEGLGPVFNQTRCSSCHDLPVSGGHGAEPVTKVSRFDESRGCSLLEEEGGDLLQASVTPAAHRAGVRPEQIPSSATTVTALRSPPLYGLGLVALVDEEEIRRRADPEDRDGDGISGRPGTAANGTLGRFGVKAQHATLAEFVAAAFLGEMGLTTPDHPHETLPNGRPLPGGVDPAPDPEIDTAQVGLIVDYIRFLAPPPDSVPDEPEARSGAREGERLFHGVGCASCHTPTMVTARHESQALDRKRFRIYSDLLLHDLGPELADICAPGAAPSEWRTAPLTGLRFRSEFLHSGRAKTFEAAILLHGGEAQAARDAYRTLDPEAREHLMRFLRTL